MASQIAHVLYVDQFLKKYPRPKSKEDFVVGALFPDIRRVSNLTRQQTHQHFEILDLEFDGLSSFEAGWKFHVWCDLRRNELLRDKKFFELEEIKNGYYLSYYFLEDKLLWKKYDNWETIKNILTDHPYIDFFPELNKTDWQYWYELMGNYVQQEPNEKSIEKFCKAQPSVATKIPRIIDEMKKLEKNKEVVRALESVCEQILKD